MKYTYTFTFTIFLLLSLLLILLIPSFILNTNAQITSIPSSGGSGNLSSSCTTYTKTYTDLTAAAVTQAIVLTSIPTRTKTWAVNIKHDTAFAGTDLTALTVSVGACNTGDCPGGNSYGYYAPAFNIFQAVSTTAFWDDSGLTSWKMTTHDLVAYFAGTFSNSKNFSNAGLSAGQVKIAVCTLALP